MTETLLKEKTRVKPWKFLATAVTAVALIAGGTVACEPLDDDCDASGTTATEYAPVAFEQPVDGRNGGTGGSKSRSGHGKSKTSKSRHGSTHHDFDDCEDDD